MNNISRKIIERLIEYKDFRNGRVRNIDLGQFKELVLKDEQYQPVFFLSTGRTGTRWFTNLLNKCSGLKAFHSPKPELIGQSKYAYECYAKGNFMFSRSLNESLSQVFIAAREELLHKTHLHGFRFIETNNRITFFAPAIKNLIPNAKFIHLYRSMQGFVESGLKRNWYSGNHPHDHGRIVPVIPSWAMSDWHQWRTKRKIHWLWQKTNGFITDFLRSIPNKDYFEFNFNLLTVKSINDLLSFLGVELNDSLIQRLINRPVNVSKK